MANPRNYISDVTKIINGLKVLDIKAVSSDPLVLTKLNKIKSQASMPLCSESLILILVEILRVYHDHRIINLTEEIDLNDKNYIKIFGEAIILAILREKNGDLDDRIGTCITNFLRTINGNQENFYHDLKTLSEKYISCVDIHFVMNSAAEAKKEDAARNKKVILVLGVTGAGKSFVINYISCQEMFSRAYFGNKLIVNHSKQPNYLKHIKIGESAVSETSEIGIVDVDKMKSLKKFHGKEYVICDTPGAGDNRAALGPEFKLANGLKTIAPMYKAQSVCFLVVISSKAISARGAEFQSTIKFVSKMFENAAKVTSAARSMVIAINGDDSDENLAKFRQQLDDFHLSRANFGFNDNDIALIEILKRKFDANEVQLIRPLKNPTATPEKLMEMLQNCPVLEPKILTPFAEADLQQLVEQEASLQAESIETIIDSFTEEEIALEVVQIQAQRLALKFAKLSFMDEYYSVNKSNILPIFTKLTELMQTFQTKLVAVLCPENSVISDKQAIKTMEYLSRLRELDRQINLIIYGSFADNRQLAVALIKALNDGVDPSSVSNINSLTNSDWANWVEDNKPLKAAKDVEDKIKAFRSSLIKRLDGLLKTGIAQLHQVRTHSLIELSQDIAPVRHAKLVKLDEHHDTFVKFIHDELNDVMGDNKDFKLDDYTKRVDKKLEEEMKKFIHVKYKETLKNVLSNLHTYKNHLSELFDEDSISNHASNSDVSSSADTDYISSQLRIHFNEAKEASDRYVQSATSNNNFQVALIAVDYIAKLADQFKLFSTIETELKNTILNILKKFHLFVESTTAQLEANLEQPLSTDDIQNLLFKINIIKHTISINAYDRYTKTVYPSNLTFALDSFEAALFKRFEKLKISINHISRNEYSADNFANLDPLFQQIWALMSMPSKCQVELVAEYANLDNAVREHCIGISGTLSGLLQNNTVLSEDLYKKIKGYLDQLSATEIFSVLKLNKAVTNVNEALNLRALNLVENANAFDLNLGHETNIASTQNIVNEITYLAQEFSDRISEATINQINSAVRAFYYRLSCALVDIAAKIQIFKTDEAENIPMQQLVQINKYLVQCEALGMFSTEIANVRTNLINYIKQYCQVQKDVMPNRIEQLSPSTLVTESTIVILDKINQFKQLQIDIPDLYAACDNPVTQWQKQLSHLASKYQIALSEALQLATSGEASSHEGLLKRVAELQVFDEDIKQYNPDGEKEKPVTFKKLHKQFENAFQTECFLRLKTIMQAIYSGDFRSAQQQIIADKAFAPGSRLRVVLIGQIGTYISASINSIHIGITQLQSNPIVKPNCMKDLMQYFDRINSAQLLVEAGLLPEESLASRDQLLQKTQIAIDSWLGAVISKIDIEIESLNLKFASDQLDTLQETLKSMNTQPNSVHANIASVYARLFAKLPQCFEQYKQPLSIWSSHAYTLPQVVTAFIQAKDLPYQENLTFANYWVNISANIFNKINDRCIEVENQFSLDQISIQDAVTVLEEIAALVNNIPSDSTNLLDQIKTRYKKTVTHIQESNFENKNEEVRFSNIEFLLQAKSLAAMDLQLAINHVYTKSEELKRIFNEAYKANLLAKTELIFFIELYERFAAFPKMDFLVKDHAYYVSKLANMARVSYNTIKTGISGYGTGVDQNQALIQIHKKLLLLIDLQSLAVQTKAIQKKLIAANFSDDVVRILFDVKQLLLANHTKFNTALAGKNVTDIKDTLLIAYTFQDVTQDIETYINTCALAPLPIDYETLKQLNSDYSYMALLNGVISELKLIRSDMEALKPKTLVAEGRLLREAFYVKVRRDVEFITTMSKLSDHLTANILEAKAIDSDYGLDACLNALSAFLEETFRLAYNQLKTTTVPTVKNDWIEFNRFYQELTIFIEQFAGAKSLASLTLSKKMLLGENQSPVAISSSSSSSLSSSSIMSLFGFNGGSNAVNVATNEKIDAATVIEFLKNTFDQYLKDVVENFKAKFVTDNNCDDELVALLAGLQKMADDMPVLVDNIKAAIKAFLVAIKLLRPKNYMASLAELLRNEEKGYGARLISEQSVFAGMMTAERNELTKTQTVEYILEHTEVQDKITGIIRNLNSWEIQQLALQYKIFEEFYARLINHYSLKMDFVSKSKEYLGELLSELLEGIRKHTPDRDSSGNVIWNISVKELIPTLYAYIFAIWTLKESPSFFDSTNTDANTNFLKKPHPAQMIAIFQMLGTIDKNTVALPSQLNEVLTGQGKSVVLASTAVVLALYGYAVDVGCYSEYLSERDKRSFDWFFKFFGVSEYVQYGTFNGLSEDMLNRNGDLRDLLKNALFDTHIDIKPKAHHGRITIALVDEVDSLITAFFGHLYQPYFLLQSELINKLLDAVWSRHENGTMNSIRDLHNLPEYTACLKHYKDRDYLIKAAAKIMFADLKKYKHDQGHDFYVNSAGELYYKHFDGTTMSKSIGYRTYWACVDKANNISKACREKQKGIKITCGAFSYADLMRDVTSYQAIMGVTGTYRELSSAEKSVVQNIFSIKQASFIPSAYGETKLVFNSGEHVHVVSDPEFNHTLFTEINKRRVGTNGQPIRPVLVFFDTEDELEAFYNSTVFEDWRVSGMINKMTSSAITTPKERDAAINHAAGSGVISLAVKEHGRGSDFILSNPQVKANGGMAVIDGFMPETEAEQRQHQGRAARQGQDGSFSMVMKQSEIIKKFGLTAEAIAEARRLGKLYSTISNARNKKFSDSYQKLVDDAGEVFNELHMPSMRLLQAVRNPGATKDEIIAAHKRTLLFSDGAVEVEVKDEKDEPREAKALILFDSTGSMASLIQALKDVLQNVIKGLGETLTGAGHKFLLKIAHYEDYYSGSSNAFRFTKNWSCDPDELIKFIENVKANGGGGNSAECVEVGLCHANQLADEGLNLVILMGDEPPTPSMQDIQTSRSKYCSGAQINSALENAKFYRTEAEALSQKGIPVSTFFIRTSTFSSIKDWNGKFTTQRTFEEIAEMTKGETGELLLNNREAAKEQLITLFGKKIITAVVGENAPAEVNELMRKYQERIQQYNR
jgi:hypothetical protein